MFPHISYVCNDTVLLASQHTWVYEEVHVPDRTCKFLPGNSLTAWLTLHIHLLLVGLYKMKVPRLSRFLIVSLLRQIICCELITAPMCAGIYLKVWLVQRQQFISQSMSQPGRQAKSCSAALRRSHSEGGGTLTWQLASGAFGCWLILLNTMIMTGRVVMLMQVR